MLKSELIGTQKRKKCLGCGVSDFFWPPQLNKDYHQESNDILIHDNNWEADYPRDGRSRWRKTTYANILEIPYWGILLKFEGENLCGEEDTSSSDEETEIDKAVLQETMSKMRQKDLDSLGKICKHCNSAPTMCALGDDGCHFYCNQSCMDKDFGGSDPLYFELDSKILEISTSYESSLRKLDIDLLLSMATKYMPNVIAVDIFIQQHYVLTNSDDDKKRCLVLSSASLLEFLNHHHFTLQAFSFGLDQCCHSAVAEMMDGGKALVPLAAMPNLAKLDLLDISFADVNILSSCIFNKNLKVLGLNSIHLESSPYGHSCSITDWQCVVKKISQMKNLITLRLEDSVLTDKDLGEMLPSLKNLKCLNVSGTFGSFQRMDPRKSMLTDQGLKYIARYCTNLQSLSVNYQYRTSSKGVKAIVESCSDLRELEIYDVPVSNSDAKEILRTSKKLLHFRCDDSVGGQNGIFDDLVKASQGRTCISTGTRGYIEVKLSPAQSRIQQSSKERVEETFGRRNDPNVYNEWEGV